MSDMPGVGAFARTVPCPLCRVLAEVPCVKQSGGRAKRSHNDRIALHEAVHSADPETAWHAQATADQLHNTIIEEKRMGWVSTKSTPTPPAA